MCRGLETRKGMETVTDTPFGYSKLDHPEVLKYAFHPRKSDSTPSPPGCVERDIVVEEGVSIGSRFFLAQGDMPHILFFHGNGEIVDDYNDIGSLYVEFGLSLMAVDYRGYGKSGGAPSVTSMMRDAHTIFNDVRRWIKNKSRQGPLFVMGRSLGSTSALDLAASYGDDVAGLIIESGFARTLPLLQCLGVDTVSLGISEADGFKNLEKVAQVSKPTLIMHARHDQIIPVMDAELLHVHCAARNKAFHMIPGADHNSILVHAGKHYFELIKRFTNNIQGIRAKRFYRRKPIKGKNTIH